jgi:hypothetical protein
VVLWQDVFGFLLVKTSVWDDRSSIIKFPLSVEWILTLKTFCFLRRHWRRQRKRNWPKYVFRAVRITLIWLQRHLEALAFICTDKPALQKCASVRKLIELAKRGYVPSMAALGLFTFRGFDGSHVALPHDFGVSCLLLAFDRGSAAAAIYIQRFKGESVVLQRHLESCEMHFSECFESLALNEAELDVIELMALAYAVDLGTCFVIDRNLLCLDSHCLTLVSRCLFSLHMRMR